MSTTYDLLALGNALVDVLATVENDFLVREGLPKGSMQLIDEPRAIALYEQMPSTTVMSGGSAANTIAGAAGLGLKTAFMGKVAQDQLGHMFVHDMKGQGIHFVGHPLENAEATGRCLVLVTPDGERTMSTYLGAAQKLAPDDIDENVVRQSAITYLEGYLWDPASAKEAFRKAARIAHEAGNKVALTLSDTFCVDRWRDEFLSLMRAGDVDIIFANASEVHALYQTADLDTALKALQQDVPLAAVTRSEQGCTVVTSKDRLDVAASPVERVVDTTGAGDLFAAGFLTGYVKGQSLIDCARLGALCAAEIISHVGARPEQNLKSLALSQGLRLVA